MPTLFNRAELYRGFSSSELRGIVSLYQHWYDKDLSHMLGDADRASYTAASKELENRKGSK